MLDLRIENGTIITMDPARPVVRALGVWRGRVFASGDDVAGMAARSVLDLRGATVVSGFVDAHTHLAWTGLKARSASVAPSRDPEAMLRVIAEAAQRVPAGGWVDVGGYDQRPLGRHLTAAELDTVSAGRRVFVTHDSGHACLVNSAVIAMLPDGVRHTDGLLTERDMAAVRRLRWPYAVDELVAAIEHAGRECRAQGVTAVSEAGIAGGLVGHSPVELGAYQTARERGRLPVRARLMVAADVPHAVAAHPADDLPKALDLGVRTGLGDEWLSVGALKVFTDGGMMARTAALTENYAGLDHAGQLADDPDVLTRTIVDGHRAGWQLAVHAIGDRAVDLALDAIAAAQAIKPGRRHRIEHAGLVRPDQLARFRELDVTAVVQPNFLWYLGDDYAQIMGPERAGWLYRGAGFLDAGVRLAASSDRPVTDGAPLRAIQFMASRLTSGGRVVGAAERMSVADALRAYTVGAAAACGWEDELGALTPGRLADFVVLEENPLDVPVSRIAEIAIRDSCVGGVSLA
ncbi:putative amidohydrolase YtcJ [Catenuloplanes nepalensis]|uniref:Amidohydrolase YtcJ n=1 Tax=Catenuloplanes nepalensis TaxID=587533 RepID=A0ABT9MVV7_9ACTN|nr:amidohydrolase [Catenuloplanes nepalensis]MDP9795572.1 putative amidohydrolase YtcJ [Catenuloplanes nepalensis]